MTRRRFLRSAGALAVLGLGGCRVGIASGGSQPVTTAASAPATTGPTTTTAARNTTTTTTVRPAITHLNVVAPPAEIPNLDPIKWADPSIQRLYRPSVEALYRWTPGGEAEPVLAAEPWDVSRDGLVYTVQLRPDVVFHDGTSLDAASVAGAFQAILDPATASQWAPRFAGSVAGIEASGATTVIFRLHRPFSPFETLLGLIPIVSMAQPYEPQQTFARSLAGTGPFRLTWEEEGTFEYTRFDQYHLPLSGIEGFTLGFATPQEAGVLVGSGTADLAVGVDAGWSGPDPLVADRSAVRIRAIANLDPARVSSSFGFRRALWKNLDRNAIVEGVLGGRGTPAYSLLSPNTDHALSQDILRNWVAEPTGPPSAGSEPVRIVTLDDATLIGAATGVQNALGDLGFGSELVTVPPGDLAATLRIGQADEFGDFDLFVAGSFAQPLTAFAPDYAYYELRSGLVTNLSKASDPELDQLLDDAVAAPPERRAGRWEAVQKYDVGSSLIEIPIVEGRYAEATTTLTGYEPSPSGNLDRLALL